ncbi:MAG: CBS domain-containing protein [Anaerolineales bacterium]
MITVRQLLESKGFDVWSVTPEASIFTALKLMAEKDVGALLVMENRKLVGIFSERDYAREVAAGGSASMEKLVRDIMTRNVYSLSPADNIQAAMSLMTEERIRHLPVVETGEVVGVISIGDVVKSTIEQQEFMIAQLENYITGTR